MSKAKEERDLSRDGHCKGHFDSQHKECRFCIEPDDCLKLTAKRIVSEMMTQNKSVSI